MENDKKIYTFQYQPKDDTYVRIEAYYEDQLLSPDGPVRLFEEITKSPIRVSKADASLHEMVCFSVDSLYHGIKSGSYEIKDYKKQIRHDIENWESSIPLDLRHTPLSEMSIVEWVDDSGEEHRVIGKDPLKLIDDVLDEIKGKDLISYHVKSTAQVMEEAEHIVAEAKDKPVSFQSSEDILTEEIKKTADMQLDGKAHWMFMNEPEFQRNFTNMVIEHLQYDEIDNLNVHQEDIQNAIEAEGRFMDSSLGHPMPQSDAKLIFEAFKMFESNKFKNGENYPWVFQPSENPKYPFDWVLWNDQYPIVQYDSKTHSLTPCLDALSLQNFNEIKTVIESAAKKKDGHYILSAADKARTESVR